MGQFSFYSVIGMNREAREVFSRPKMDESKKMIKWQYPEAVNNACQLHEFYNPATTNFSYNIFPDSTVATAYIEAST